jgi:membrane-associated PAP2 superfamily phosphatase
MSKGASGHRLSTCRWAGLLVGISGIIVTLALEVFTDLDIQLQDHFFNFQTGEWLVNSRAPLPRFVFYSLPKLVLYPAGALMLLAVFQARVRSLLQLSRRQSLYLFCCIAGVPLVAGIGKNVTHVHCPSELRRYGGPEEYARVIASERTSYAKYAPHCFPAGHASGGFALLGLYFLRRKPIWLLPGLIAGWIMGLYQMFKGAHFLSHTLTTMFLALALSAALSAIVQKEEDA